MAETVRGRVPISFALIAFIATVAFIVIFFNFASDGLHDWLDLAASNTSNEYAMTMIGHARSIIDWSILWGTGIAAFGFLMDSAFQGRGP